MVFVGNDLLENEVKLKRKINNRETVVFSTKQHRSKSATEFWLRCELTNNGQTACMLFACFHFDKYVWMDCNMCVALPLLHLYTQTHIRTHIQIRSKHRHIEITKRHSIWPRIIKNKWYEKQANICARLISHRIVNGRVAWNFLHVFVYLVHTMTEVCFECASSGVCVYQESMCARHSRFASYIANACDTSTL